MRNRRLRNIPAMRGFNHHITFQAGRAVRWPVRLQANVRTIRLQRRYYHEVRFVDG